MRRQPHASGFSMIELMIVMVIFLIVTGAVFGLLNVAQQRYRAEQQLLESLQGARLGIEQLTRDIHRAGFPPLNGFDTTSADWADENGVPVNRIAVPLVGMVGNNVVQTCTVNGGFSPCTIPNPWELVIETDLEPDGTVDWIYYRLDTPGNAVNHPPIGGGADPVTRTLYRAVAPKSCTGPIPWIPMQCTGANPAASGGTPFVDNVVQDPALGVTAANPAVFVYVCRDLNLDGVPDPTCTPENIQDVRIQLQARAQNRDMRTRQVRALTLLSTARIMNPPQ